MVWAQKERSVWTRDEGSAHEHARAPHAGPQLADQQAAVTSGLTSLTQGASRVFEGGAVVQTVVEMQRGVLVIMAISNGSSIAVLAASTCDLGLVAYEMTLLVERAGRVLTPATRSVMQAAIPGDGRR